MNTWKRLALSLAHTLKDNAWDILSPIVTGRLQTHVNNILPTPAQLSNARFSGYRAASVSAVDGAVIDGNPGQAWAKFAIRKGLPSTESGKVLIIENDPHQINDFDGVIPEGYGKGVKRLLYSGIGLVKIEDKVTASKINYHVHDADRAGLHYDLVVENVPAGTKRFEFQICDGPYKGRYAVVPTLFAEPEGRQMIRMIDRGVVIEKPDYRLRDEAWLAKQDPSQYVFERKYDGSLGNAHIHKSQASFRSHRETGETYYGQLPAVESLRNTSPFWVLRQAIPGPNLNGTILRGELVHESGPEKMSGILNSSAVRARQFQEKHGNAQFYVWDVVKYRGRDVSHKSYVERRQLAEKIVEEVRPFNKNWHIAESMPEGGDPVEFYKHVISDPKHVYREGIIAKPKDDSENWSKVKARTEADLVLVELLEGSGKYSGSVGRAVVQGEAGHSGEVGSFALSDEERQWLWDNREALKGATVKIKAQNMTSEKQIPRAGVFVGVHPDKSPEQIKKLLAERNL